MIKEGEFEEAFRRAEPIIAGMKGYLSHSLSKVYGRNALIFAACRMGDIGGSYKRLSRSAGISGMESLTAPFLFTISRCGACSGYIIIR